MVVVARDWRRNLVFVDSKKVNNIYVHAKADVIVGFSSATKPFSLGSTGAATW